MITRIQATNYRCFESLDVQLQPYSVLAGPNGSGKTTLLDIPTLFADLIQERNVSTAFLRSRQPDQSPRAQSLIELVYQMQGEYFTIALEVMLPTELKAEMERSRFEKRSKARDLTHLRYELAFQVFNGTELNVAREELLIFGVNKKGKMPKDSQHMVLQRESGEPARVQPERRRLENSGQRKSTSPYVFRTQPVQVALSSVPFDTEEFPVTTWFRDFLTSETVFYEPDMNLLRRASRPGLGDNVISNAENLPWLALKLKQDNSVLFDAWVDHVSSALPRVQSITAHEREEDHFAYLELGYSGGYSVTSSGLSEGTLRVLALTILPYLSRPPKSLVTEEPENGIHPRAIESVLLALRSIQESSVWVSTHSAIVLASTKRENLFISRISRDGGVQVVRGDQHPRLQDWQGNIDLGMLFAAGVLS
jgi:predicted ATPase